MSIQNYKPLDNTGIISANNATFNNNIGIVNTGNGQTLSIQTNSATTSYSLVLPTSLGTSGQLLTSGGAGGNLTWSTVSGSGTVTSVGLSSSSNLIAITSSPVTTTGVININPALSTSGTPTAFLTNVGPTIASGGLIITAGDLTVSSGKITANYSSSTVLSATSSAAGLNTSGTLAVVSTNSLDGTLISAYASSLGATKSCAICFGRSTTNSEGVYFGYVYNGATTASNNLAIGIFGQPAAFTCTYGGDVTITGKTSVAGPLTVTGGAPILVQTTTAISTTGSTITATMVGNFISVTSAVVVALTSDTGTNICTKIGTTVGTSITTILYNSTATAITYSGGTGVTLVGASVSSAQTVYITFVVTGTNTLNMIIK